MKASFIITALFVGSVAANPLIFPRAKKGVGASCEVNSQCFSNKCSSNVCAATTQTYPCRLNNKCPEACCDIDNTCPSANPGGVCPAETFKCSNNPKCATACCTSDKSCPANNQYGNCPQKCGKTKLCYADSCCSTTASDGSCPTGKVADASTCPALTFKCTDNTKCASACCTTDGSCPKAGGVCPLAAGAVCDPMASTCTKGTSCCNDGPSGKGASSFHCTTGNSCAKRFALYENYKGDPDTDGPAGSTSTAAGCNQIGSVGLSSYITFGYTCQFYSDTLCANSAKLFAKTTSSIYRVDVPAAANDKAKSYKCSN